MTRIETTASHSRPFAMMAGRVLWAVVVALATACGGGGESTPVANVNQPVVTTPPPASPPPATAYSVVVKTVDTQGQPIAGVSVALTGRLDLRAGTGGDGTTTFAFGASQTGAAFLYASLTGYHPAYRQLRLEATSSPIVQQLTLMRTDEAQLVLSGVKSEISADAASVVVSADIAVAGLNGSPIAGLSAADFTVPELDCLFTSVCILEPSGAPSLSGYWTLSQRNPVQVTLPGAGPSTLYNVRYVLEATPGMFTAGRAVLTWVYVRVGDSLLTIQTDVRL